VGNKFLTKLHKRAARHRDSMTPSERAVRGALHRADVIYYAQYVLSPHIADFYLPAEHIVIEVDGITRGSHATAIDRDNDRRRDRYMRLHHKQPRIIRLSSAQAHSAPIRAKLLSIVSSGEGLSGQHTLYLYNPNDFGRQKTDLSWHTETNTPLPSKDGIHGTKTTSKSKAAC
jgi:very-short-patch-repair endonuclease